MTSLMDTPGTSVNECLLCHRKNPRIVDTIPYVDLRRAYLEAFGIDIATCIERSPIGDKIEQYRCDLCQIEFFPPSLAGNELLYRKLSENSWYYGAEKWEFGLAREFLAPVESVLEIGCGAGKFLDIVKQGFPAIRRIGLEFTPKSARTARSNGHTIHEQTIESFSSIPENQAAFPLICSFQVLEHVPDPLSFVKSSAKCLSPGGHLILSTPNRDGFARYSVNDLLNLPPHHLSRWNKETFASLARQMGLELIRIEYEPVAEYHREWYRFSLLSHRISSLIGVKLKKIEFTDRRLSFRIISALSRILDHSVPKSAWRFDLPGHTLCAVFRKPTA